MLENKNNFVVRFARGFEDRANLLFKLMTNGPVTPYVAVCDWVYMVDKVPVFDELWVVLMGYDRGFCYFADYRSKGVVPPTEKQETDLPGFEWNEEMGKYVQKVWRGCLKPDRER